jgi:Tol biopolymer transport system component
MSRNLLITYLLILTSWTAFSQTTVLNNNRTGLKWRSIKTEDFKILFPKGFESEAQRMANTLQLIHDPVDKSLGTDTRRATILLQNQTSVSNGFVTMGPRRSEFFTSAPHDYNFLGTNDWLNTLAVHEYRHLAQFNKSRTGFNKFFYYLFGQNTQAAMASVAAPQWFWEGDATVTETAFTQSGRGRIAAFNRVFRANLLEGKRFKYHKQAVRSYKDFVPGHYVLGYHMVSHIRKKTDNGNVFSDITQKTWQVPFMPFAFSSALKKSTGKYVVDNYEDMMDELHEEWSSQLEEVTLSPFETVTQRSNDGFTDYSNPIFMANGKMFVVKSGIGDIEQFMMISEDGTEEKLFTPGLMNNSGMMSAAGNTVAWNEYAFDPRWRNQSYSVIKLYNHDTKTLKVLTKKTRYHGVSLSPDARQVATIESLEDGTYRLVLLDSKTGSVIKTFVNLTEGLLTLPSWSSDGEKLTFLSNKSQKKSVQVIDIETEVETVLITSGTENIGNPGLFGDYLIFQSDYSGIDNIYALNVKKGMRYQVTSSKYGAYNFTISNDQKNIYYNDHSVDGLDIVRSPFDPSKWISQSQVNEDKIGYFQTLEDQENHSHLLDSVPNKEFEVEKHSPLKGLINPHSWGPFLDTDDLNQVQAGVFSRDVLSTTSIYAGYDYNIDTQDGAMVGRVSYQGFYPILDFEFKKGSRTDGASTWDEQTIEYGVRIPLLLTKSKYHTQLNVGNSIGHTSVSNYKNGVDDLGRLVDSGIGRELVRNDQGGIDTLEVPTFRLARLNELSDGGLTFNHFEVSFFKLMKQSLRDINSRFGISLAYENFNAIGGDFSGGLSALRYNVFLPGLMKHHSISIRGGIQSREISSTIDLYAFTNRIFRPRGYSYFTDKKFNSIMFNYSLPIWYPDISIGPVLNIKRIKLNAFFDYGQDDNQFFFLRQSNLNLFGERIISSKYTSFGAELTFDINIMRSLPELEIGARFVYANAVNTFGVPAASKLEFIIGNISF